MSTLYTTANSQNAPSVSKWVVEAIRRVSLAIIVCIYSVLAITWEATFFLLRKIPHIVGVILFYSLMAIFGLFLVTVVLSYSILVVVSVNISLP